MRDWSSRNPRGRAIRHVLTVAALACLGLSPRGEAGGWPQWGGPARNFKVESTGLAKQWSEAGPKRLWTRPLGEGFSSIVFDSERLYTMCRQGEDEVVVALEAETGRTIWEHRYRAVPYPEQTSDYGFGPNAAPLVMDGRVITIGFSGLMHCLEAKSGELLWSRDLVKDFNGSAQYYGYANGALAYKGAIVTLVGGSDCGVAALNPRDGSVLWKSPPSEISYASPILINVDGQDQVVFFSPTEVRGMDPVNGAFLWSHPVANFCHTNCTSAIWGQDNLLWAATKSVGGTRVLKLTQREGKTNVEQVWLNRKVKIDFWNAVRVGEFVYASIGDTAPMLAAVDVKTGEIVERQRGLAAANGVYADGRLILLDHHGRLALAEISLGKINIVSSVQLFDSATWTPPTLVGTRLYVRDRERIMALDLS